MTEVVVERDFPEPRTESDLRAMFDAASGCMKMHRVTWHGSVLSLDGRNMVCHYTAPDAESVRIVSRQAGIDEGRAWSATVHDPPGFAMEDIGSINVAVSRRFDAPVDFAAIQALEDAGSGCLEIHRVRFVRTLFAADRRRMICFYHAPDAESARIAQREAGMPVERVWAVRRYAP